MQCTAEAAASSTHCSTCAELGTCPLPDGETVDLSHALRGSMRVQGQQVLAFEATATFERLVVDHVLEVRATQSAVLVFLDGERLGTASETADHHAVIRWFGACQ